MLSCFCWVCNKNEGLNCQVVDVFGHLAVAELQDSHLLVDRCHPVLEQLGPLLCNELLPLSPPGFLVLEGLWLLFLLADDDVGRNFCLAEGFFGLVVEVFFPPLGCLFCFFLAPAWPL